MISSPSYAPRPPSPRPSPGGRGSRRRALHALSVGLQSASAGRGTSVAMPLAVTSGVPGSTSLKFTPSPRRLCGNPAVGPGTRTPATTRMAMSVTSSLGRRPLGQPAGSGVGLPAASCASTVRRFWSAAGVGGTVRSSRSSSEHGLSLEQPFGFWPAYFSSTATRSLRGVAGIGMPKARFKTAASLGF